MSLLTDGRRPAVDKPTIERAVRTIISAIGEDPDREGLVGTPERIADMYEELFAGLREDPSELLEVGFDDEDHHEMVIVRDIPFYSMCEHHFMPFHGVAHVGYIPMGRILGVSKVARLVEMVARRAAGPGAADEADRRLPLRRRHGGVGSGGRDRGRASLYDRTGDQEAGIEGRDLCYSG